jgi:ADP-ribosylation factor-like protein 13B
MFGLLFNLYNYVQKKSERKVTLITLGLDGAGKTTAINTIQGELEKEVSPTFGFNAQTLKEGKYKV